MSPVWELAKCHTRKDDLFFPDTGRQNKKARQAARDLCTGRDGLGVCPILEACRDWAIESGIREGIWGGLSDRERRRFAKARSEEAAVSCAAEYEDEDLRQRGQGRHRDPHPVDADAAGGRGRGRASGHDVAARQRTGQRGLLPQGGVLPTGELSAARARKRDRSATAGDLRGRSRRTPEVPALDASAGEALREMAVRGLPLFLDGDIAV